MTEEDSEALKLRGNEAFRAQQYDEAIKLYSKVSTSLRIVRPVPFRSLHTCVVDLLHQAIVEDDKNATLFSNRCAALLAMNRDMDRFTALDDANRCVELRPDWPKAFSRRGAALLALGRYRDALNAYQAGLLLDASNDALKSGLELTKETLMRYGNQDRSLGHPHRAGMARATTETPSPKRDLTPEQWKEEGNAAFKQQDLRRAIRCYTEALALDAGNHVLYSNRSAAYCARGDRSSLRDALADADRCIALRPDWGKGFVRRASALLRLGRFADAVQASTQGLRVDPAMGSLFQVRTRAEQAQNDPDVAAAIAAEVDASDRAVEREEKEEKDERERRAIAIDKDTPEASLEQLFEQLDSIERGAAEGSPPAAATGDDGAPEEPTGTEAEVSDEVRRWDPGAPEKQVERLTQENYRWINLNPFEVLQLPEDATLAEIRMRHRHLSAAVHPDKVRHPNAEIAFQAVRTAHDALRDPVKRELARTLVKDGRDAAEKQRRKRLRAGEAESALPTLDEMIQTETRRRFAQMEHRKRTVEDKAQKEAREEVEEFEQEKEERKRESKKDAEWAARREKRVSNWRDFVDGEPSKKRKRTGATARPAHSANVDDRAAAQFRPEESYKAKWR